MLSSCSIEDAGLANLAQLPNLKTLNITSNKVTDAGLAHLKTIKNLEKLVLTGNPGITPGGVTSLKETLPDCNVVTEPSGTPATATKGDL